MAVALGLVLSELDVLGVERFVGLEKSEKIAGVEIQARSVAAEVVAVGLGFYRFVCFAAVSGPEQGYVPVAADTG